MKIRWLDEAVLDLEDAYEFILFEHPQAAASEVHKVLRAVERLGENPAMGKAGRVPKTREMVVSGSPYIVIYRAKNDCLEILRVFHGARRRPERSKK